MGGNNCGCSACSSTGDWLDDDRDENLVTRQLFRFVVGMRQAVEDGTVIERRGGLADDLLREIPLDRRNSASFFSKISAMADPWATRMNSLHSGGSAGAIGTETVSAAHDAFRIAKSMIEATSHTHALGTTAWIAPPTAGFEDGATAPTSFGLCEPLDLDFELPYPLDSMFCVDLECKNTFGRDAECVPNVEIGGDDYSHTCLCMPGRPPGNIGEPIEIPITIPVIIPVPVPAPPVTPPPMVFPEGDYPGIPDYWLPSPVDSPVPGVVDTPGLIATLIALIVAWFESLSWLERLLGAVALLAAIALAFPQALPFMGQILPKLLPLIGLA